MKTANLRFIRFITAIMITALFLVGTVPSYAAPEEEQELSIVPAITVDEKDVPKVKGTSAILMDLNSGMVIYEKNADKVREPASLTKILTALVVLENMDLDEVVTVQEGIETEGSIVGLIPGEKITVEELLYGLMLPSGNDAAEALAIACAGSIEDFSEMMNDRAILCGAEKTNYKNPNGLNENRSRLNWTSAKDLALISAEAMKIEKFREIVSSKRHTIPATNKSEPRKLVNSNLCLWDKVDTIVMDDGEVPVYYEGCSGVKTGMTSDAGYCFVGTAERDGSQYLAVTLNAPDSLTRFQDVIKLWDYAFDTFTTHTVIEKGTEAGVQRVKRGSVRKVPLVVKSDLGVTVNRDQAEDPGITTEFMLDEEKLTAPVEKDQEVGRILALDSGGNIVGIQALYTAKAVPEGGPLSYVGIEDREAPWVLGGAGALLLLIILIAVFRGRKKRRVSDVKREDMRSQLVKMRTAGEGMTPAEWSELVGDPREVPIPQGPSRLTDDELAEINAPEITRMEKPAQRPKPAEPVDPNKPRRHGRLTQEELDELLSGMPRDKK